MLFVQWRLDAPAAATNTLCSICTSFGVYTEFGIDPVYNLTDKATHVFKFWYAFMISLQVLFASLSRTIVIQ